MKKRKKTILITGGLGVIGSYLSKELQKRGYRMVINDLKILKKENYHRGDITQYAEMSRIFDEFNVDTVFHLAGEVGRENGEEFPRRCVDINVSGTINLIQLCMKYKTKLIFASTSEIYGKLAGKMRLTENLVERYAPLLTNCYAISKLQAEQYLQHFTKYYKLKSASVRFFMCYGEGEYPNPYRSAMCNFIYNILNNKPINVHQNTSRSWCYISDIVDGLIKVMTKNNFSQYEAYNIGRDDLQKTEDVAKTICKLAGKPTNLIQYSSYNYLVTPKKDASFEKAKKKLGYKSKISLEKGIKNTIAWQKKVLNIKD